MFGGEAELIDSAEFAKDHGFELIQISMDSARFFPENIPVKKRAEIRDHFIQNSIGLCFHGPTDLPTMNRHAPVRNAAIDRILEMIDLAIDLGGEYFVFHPGRLAVYSLNRKQIFFMEKAIPRIYLRYFTEAIKKITGHAKDRITICIENTHAVPQQFLEMIAECLKNHNLKLVWDIGHAEMLPGNDRDRMITFLQENSSYVKLFHLHDVTEKGDHKTLGTGRVEVKTYLEIIDTIEADTILEIFPNSELVKSKEYLNNIRATVEPG